MRGQITEPAEVVGAGDDAPTKDVMPKAVDDDPGGERVFLHVGHLLGEFESATLLGVEGRGIECVEETAWDDL